MTKRIKIFEIVTALGLVLFPIDNYILGGQIGIRVGGIGLILLVIGSIGILFNTKRFNGDKWTILFILIIASGVFVDSIVRADALYKFYNAGLVIAFLLLYFIGNKSILRFFPYAVIIEAVSCIVQGVMNINGITDIQTGYFVGGIVTSKGEQFVINYNLACGYMSTGMIFSNERWQKILLPVVILAVFFTGSIEGIYIIGAIFIWMIVKKNYNKRMWYGLSVVAIFITLWCVFGTGVKIWYRLLPTSILITDTGNSHELGWKLDGYKYFIENFKFFGNGYLQTVSSKIYDTVHNVPLVVVQQIGVVPAVAWIVGTIRSIIKNGFNLMWLGLLVMCIFDHMVWTNLAIYWWLIMGLSNRKEVYNE